MKPHDEHAKRKRRQKKRVRDQRRTRRAMKKLFFETMTIELPRAEGESCEAAKKAAPQ